MKKKNKRKYPYTVLLGSSFILAAIVWAANALPEAGAGIALSPSMSTESVQVSAYAGPEGNFQSPEMAQMPEAGDTSVSKEDQRADRVIRIVGDRIMGPDGEAQNPDGNRTDGDGQEPGSDQEEQTAGDTTADSGAAQEPGTGGTEGTDDTNQEPAMYTADVSYFDDALFIGDSRTVGLREYGGLGNAEVAADTGMDVYQLFEKEFKLVSGEKKLLETLLSERQFGKIYIMLGINELGYNFDSTVAKFGEVAARIQELQPGAYLFIQANLRVSKEKSEDDSIYTNESIDRFNQAVGAFADNRTWFYLDANEIFDDGQGNLGAEYTADSTHLLGKYYASWVEWILAHARMRPQ